MLSTTKKWAKTASAAAPSSALKVSGDTFTVVQEPLLQGALVSLDAKTGAVRALVGGYDYHSKTFNRATQAMRQPGSTFKPFVYSAALAKGMTASTMINDAPISLPGKGANGKAWNPKIQTAAIPVTSRCARL